MASTGKRGTPRGGCVALGAKLVIGTAIDLHVRLGKALAKPGLVVLDAAAVTHVDTAGLQLLHAFVQARSDAARPWRWDNVGDALRAAAAQLGLEQMLGLPAANPAARC